MASVQIITICDAPYSTASEIKSQLGIVENMADKKERDNTVHHGSNRCNWVFRSALPSKNYTPILAYDCSYAIRNVVEEPVSRPVIPEANVDSRTLNDVLTRDSYKTERMLQIGISMLEESYSHCEILKIRRTPWRDSTVDAQTEKLITHSTSMW